MYDITAFACVAINFPAFHYFTRAGHRACVGKACRRFSSKGKDHVAAFIVIITLYPKSLERNPVDQRNKNRFSIEDMTCTSKTQYVIVKGGLESELKCKAQATLVCYTVQNKQSTYNSHFFSRNVNCKRLCTLLLDRICADLDFIRFCELS